jgi:hypothetical protein
MNSSSPTILSMSPLSDPKKSLCAYSTIFGKPKEGIHSYRIFNIAIMDVIMTIIFALFVSIVYKWTNGYEYKTWVRIDKTFLVTLGLSFLFGIISHRLFCVMTTVDKLLFSTE